MNNPTDTNQASEDILTYGVDRGIPGGDSTALSIKKGSTLVAFTGDEAVAIIDLIRTEKLKLLAEIRERVVGEDMNVANMGDTFKANYARGYNVSKVEMRDNLAKLEAEL